jgi:hypothetical protein
MEVRNFTSLLLGIEDIDIDLTSFATFQKKLFFAGLLCSPWT